MDNGWIRLHRKSLNSSIWVNPVIWFVWCWCLLKANHEINKFPFNGKDIAIKPGQFITGRSKALSELPMISPQNYKTAINYLKLTNRITSQITNKFTIISIIKWDEYQKNKDELTSKLTSKLNNHQPATNQPLTTNKNEKNDKNEKNKITYVSPDGDGFKDLMEIFYKINPSLNYGNKTTRSAAEWLISKLGARKALKIAEYAVSLLGIKYAPQITTPYELKEKLTKLLAYHEQNKPKISTL